MLGRLVLGPDMMSEFGTKLEQNAHMASAVLPHTSPQSSRADTVHVLSGRLPTLVGQKGCMGLPPAAVS